MVGVQAEGLRDDLLQLDLDLERILARREPGPVADTEDVRVDRERFFIEGGVKDDVGRLAAYARQLFELLARAGHLPAMVADQRFRQGDDVLRLRVEQADRLDRVPEPVLA